LSYRLKMEDKTSGSTNLAQPHENSITSANISVGIKVLRKRLRNQMTRLRGTLPFCTRGLWDPASNISRADNPWKYIASKRLHISVLFVVISTYIARQAAIHVTRMTPVNIYATVGYLLIIPGEAP
jgi:hypothetical protein